MRRLNADPDRLNRAPELGEQPAPSVCSCGAVRTWGLWPTTSSRAYGRMSPRWVCPRVDPCSSCEVDHARRIEDGRLERAMHRAGIEPRDRVYSWDRVEVERPPRCRCHTKREACDRCLQHRADWQARIRWKAPPTIGVLAEHEEAARVVAKWRPELGHSIYIMGATGSGKTTFASALARRLLQVSPRRRRERTREELLTRTDPTTGRAEPRFSERQADRMIATKRNFVVSASQQCSVMMISDPELYERVKLGWSRDRAPLAKISEADALILDDLGMTGKDPLVGERAPPGSQEGIQRLIRDRYARGRHLVITSNIPFEPVFNGDVMVKSGIKAWYGARVYDRLREMVGVHVYSLGASSWR